MESNIYDVVIVGGGMAGAHAAWPLVQSGRRVLMLDGGIEASGEVDSFGAKEFAEIRATEAEQSRLFLGETLEGIVQTSGKSHAASMTSGSRAYVSEKTSSLLPLKESGVELMQSLAKGGLSEAWGGVCSTLTASELEAAGIPENEIRRHYQEVIERIGVSGVESGYRTQPPATLTTMMERLLARYRSSRFILRQPLMALLTQPLKGRKALAYRDLEFYPTGEKALYRARYTIEELQQKKNFHYLPGHIVEKITRGDVHEVVTHDFSAVRHTFRGRRVVLAAGAVNSTRIALQSGFIESAELFVKPNYILACLYMRSLGARDERPRHSLCQLTLDVPEEGHSSMYAHLYVYRSLLLSRLLSRVPLPTPEALSLLALFVPSFVLVDARLPATEHTCRMTLEDGVLVVQRNSMNGTARPRLRALKKILRSLGLFTLHTGFPSFGASIHYAGGLTVSSRGELDREQGIYVADSAGWRALSAKPPALTIMANANRIGESVDASLGHK